MENKNTYCTVCGTENEEGYIYCKNCGAELKIKPVNPSAPPESHTGTENTGNVSYTYTPPQNSAPQPNFYGTEQKVRYSGMACDIDGITVKEMYCFVGKNANKIVPKFTKMHLTKSKTSWCWPAAVLGFFFGPIGTAVWFFYRKMYKMALIAAAVGVLLIGIIGAIGGSTVSFSDSNEQLTEALESGDITSFFDALSETSSTRSILAKNINNLINIATLVLAGLFSLKIYKDFTLQKIKEYRLRGIDRSFYYLALYDGGGTSGGMAIVGVLILFFSRGISAVVSNLL